MLRSVAILTCVFLLTSLSGLGQDVIIKGQVDSSYLSLTNSVYAYTYDDHISFRERELGTGKLDASGNFNISFPMQQTTLVMLMVDNAKAEMLVEPRKQYSITILAKDSDATNTLSAINPVGMEFQDADRNELNFLIADFTMRYEILIDDYQGNIARKEPAIFKKIDTLEMLFKKKYSEYKNAYLDTYIHYTFATLEDNTSLESKENVFRKHIDGKPVLLNNQAYMTFFNQFYAVTADYFAGNPKMMAAVNNMQSFASTMDLFKQSVLLSNDTIREAVALKALAEHYRYPEYKKSAVLAVLDQAAKECKSPDNRKAAENLRKKFSVMNPGKPVPKIAFREMGGDGFLSLPDLKGKYLYVNFYTTMCASCMQDMTLIPDLKKAYGKNITFVSISLDKKEETVKNFIKKNPKFSPERNGGGWLFLYSDNYKQVKQEYNVLSVPTYFLIDPYGNVVKAPAAAPADIEQELMDLKKKR